MKVKSFCTYIGCRISLEQSDTLSDRATCNLPLRFGVSECRTVKQGLYRRLMAIVNDRLSVCNTDAYRLHTDSVCCTVLNPYRVQRLQVAARLPDARLWCGGIRLVSVLIVTQLPAPQHH